MEKKITYNVREVAELLNINVAKAYELTKRKDFPAIRLGRRIVVPKDAFFKWLELAAQDKESSSFSAPSLKPCKWKQVAIVSKPQAVTGFLAFRPLAV